MTDDEKRIQKIRAAVELISKRDKLDLIVRRVIQEDVPYLLDRLKALEGMIWYANQGRCIICGWTLAATKNEGCVPGNCSYRPTKRAHDYFQGIDRKKALAALKEADDGS
jgi:hypothetical protein